jgi:phosphoglycerate dehydrogenase-like enzyme
MSESKAEQPPVVLVTEHSEAGPLRWLAERARVIEAAPDSVGFSEKLAQAKGLLVRTYTKVNDQFLAQAPNLKVVGRGGVGLENIDVSACRRRGIEVVYTPDANTLAVGDFVFGYLIRLVRGWSYFKDEVLDPKEFKRARDTLRGKQLNEMTLGILGMGRVGRRVGHIAANGFGMNVLYNDLQDVRAHLNFPATAVDKPTLYQSSDVLSIHVDMRPGNENMVGRDQLELMKRGVLVINTSRGEVLDVNALADALKSGKAGGAALDVFYPEPPKPGFPLLGMENVILTPHIAARTTTAMENMGWVVRDLAAVLEGRKPRYPAPGK